MKRIPAALAAIAALAALSPAFAEEPKAKLQKDETVYAVLDPSGAVKSVTVSDWLHGPLKGGELRDRSDLAEIENVKAKDAPRRSGDELVWKPAGDDVYYRGKSAKSLPFSVSVSYWLDGKRLDPKAMAGKSGSVRIRVEVRNLALGKASAAGGAKVYAPLAMVVGADLPAASFRDIEVSGGRLITDGQNNIAAGILLPGLRETIAGAQVPRAAGAPAIPEALDKLIPGDSFEIRAKVTDFSFGPLMLAASPSLPEVDAKDAAAKLRGALDGIAQLGEASAAIRSGSAQLAEGAAQLHQGIATATGATKPLLEGDPTLDKALAFIQSDEDVAAARRLVAEARKLSASAPELVGLLSGALDPATRSSLDKVMKDASAIDMKALLGSPLAGKVVSEESLAAMAEAIKASDELYSGFDEKKLAALADFAAGSPAVFAAARAFEEASASYREDDGAALAELAKAKPRLDAAEARSRELGSFDAAAAAAGLAASSRAQSEFLGRTAFLEDGAALASLQAKLASGGALTKAEAAELSELLAAAASGRPAMKAGAAAAGAAAEALPALAAARELLPVATAGAAAAAGLEAGALPALAAARQARGSALPGLAAATKVLDPAAAKSIAANVRNIGAAKRAYEKNKSTMQLAKTYLALKSKQGGFKGQIAKLESLQRDAASLGPLLDKLEAVEASPEAKALLGSPEEAKAKLAALVTDGQRLSPYLELGDAVLSEEGVTKARQLAARLPELKDGLAQLDSGSALLAEKLGELAAGTAKFDDEGIKKLESELGGFGGTALAYLETADEMAAAANEYRIFTKAPSEAKTALKYILRTEEIK